METETTAIISPLVAEALERRRQIVCAIEYAIDLAGCRGYTSEEATVCVNEYMRDNGYAPGIKTHTVSNALFLMGRAYTARHVWNRGVVFYSKVNAGSPEDPPYADSPSSPVDLDEGRDMPRTPYSSPFTSPATRYTPVTLEIARRQFDELE